MTDLQRVGQNGGTAGWPGHVDGSTSLWPLGAGCRGLCAEYLPVRRKHEILKKMHPKSVEHRNPYDLKL